MYPSGSSRNPIPLDKLLLQSSHIYNENPSLRQAHEHSSSFLQFPMLCLDQEDQLRVNHLLYQRQQHTLLGNPSLADTEASVVVAEDGSNAMAEEQVPTSKTRKKSVPRKRSGKTDRHSKIYTAQGLRDRRMRLSLPIARKFFDLQDMLGFDKASKTIEWLFTNSKNSIKELTNNLQEAEPGSSNGAKSMSSTSENEVVSGTQRRENSNGDLGSMAAVSKRTDPRERKLDKVVPKLNRVPKELRDKARERARERAREKTKNRGLVEELKQPSDVNQQMNPSLTSVTEEKESQPYAQLAYGEHRIDSFSNDENYLGFTSPTFSSYSRSIATVAETDPKDAFSAFPGNWENNWFATAGNLVAQSSTASDTVRQMKTTTFMNIVSNAHDSHFSPIFMRNSVAQNKTLVDSSSSTKNQDPFTIGQEQFLSS